MTDRLEPKTGWMMLHLFGKARPSLDHEAIKSAIKEAQEDEHRVVTVSLLGHKADACFMIWGPDMWRLRHFQTALQSAGVEVVDSFLSLTEISEYAPDTLTEGMKRPRLAPPVPENKNAWCFYPMNKRRTDANNWYDQPYDRRKELMYEHGTSGRAFAGRVEQIVTASTGLDDWEWQVTLFAQHPDDLKDCVYTMRYDEASRLYGEFGRFYTGMVAEPDVVLTNMRP